MFAFAHIISCSVLSFVSLAVSQKENPWKRNKEIKRSHLIPHPVSINIILLTSVESLVTAVPLHRSKFMCSLLSNFISKGILTPKTPIYEFEPARDKTNKMTVRPAKTQISLGIRPAWSESSLCAQWVAKDPSFLHADSVDSDQTGRMPRLIWVCAGRTVILLVLS